MSIMAKKDLIYQYSWIATENDNKNIIGFPDNKLLYRGEGYEVLYFINRFLKNNMKSEDQNINTGQLIEKMIKKVPSDKRSHKNIKEYIFNNWNTLINQI